MTAFNGESTGAHIRRKSSVLGLQHAEVVRDDEDDPLPAKNEQGPQVGLRDVFGPWLHEHAR